MGNEVPPEMKCDLNAHQIRSHSDRSLVQNSDISTESTVHMTRHFDLGLRWIQLSFSLRDHSTLHSHFT